MFFLKKYWLFIYVFTLLTLAVFALYQYQNYQKKNEIYFHLDKVLKTINDELRNELSKVENEIYPLNELNGGEDSILCGKIHKIKEYVNEIHKEYGAVRHTSLVYTKMHKNDPFNWANTRFRPIFPDSLNRTRQKFYTFCNEAIDSFSLDLKKILYQKMESSFSLFQDEKQAYVLLNGCLIEDYANALYLIYELKKQMKPAPFKSPKKGFPLMIYENKDFVLGDTLKGSAFVGAPLKRGRNDFRLCIGTDTIDFNQSSFTVENSYWSNARIPKSVGLLFRNPFTGRVDVYESPLNLNTH